MEIAFYNEYGAYICSWKCERKWLTMPRAQEIVRLNGTRYVVNLITWIDPHKVCISVIE